MGESRMEDHYFCTSAVLCDTDTVIVDKTIHL